MDFTRRFIVFAIAAIAAPATMMIGAHLSFPVNNKSFTNSPAKMVSNPPGEMRFVNVELKDESSTNENNISSVENTTVSYPVKTKTPYFGLFYFSGKSVYETSLANLFKK